jgi:ferric-dicitrate binding protein FerR (iron transport regulator)
MAALDHTQDCFASVCVVAERRIWFANPSRKQTKTCDECKTPGLGCRERVMIDRRNFLLLGAGFAAASGSPMASAGEAAGRVTTLTGMAHAITNKMERPLAANATIAIDDLVQTAVGARLSMILGKNTLVHLGPSTKLKIERYLVDAGGAFDLVEGSMLFEHQRPRGTAAQKAVVRSPYGLIAVRGTKFFAGPSKGVFGVFVAEGLVDVIAAQKTVRLRPGFGTDILRPGLAPSLPKRWARPRIREGLALTLGGPRAPR